MQHARMPACPAPDAQNLELSCYVLTEVAVMGNLPWQLT